MTEINWYTCNDFNVSVINRNIENIKYFVYFL